MTSVRISAAAPDADLLACIQPGVTCVYLPRVESPEVVQHADALITALEKRRGIRPRTVEIRPLVESSRGVVHADEVAASSPRIQEFGIGPHIDLELGGDSLAYARAECDLAARSLELVARDVELLRD